MEENILVSIIVPIYNTEQFLERCVNSIIEQTYLNIEIILVDDGSTDDSGQLCDELAKKDSRIKVIHKENGGLSDARNAGIDAASGLKICFIDSDDVINRCFVETLLNASIKYSCSIAQCNVQKFSREEEILEENDNAAIKVIHRKDLINNMSTLDVVACNKLYDTKLFEYIKFPKGKIHEDLATTYKIYDKVEKVIILDTKLYFYYGNPNGITGSKIKNNKIDLLQIYLEQYEFFKTKKEYKIACEKAANNLGASWGALMSHKKSDYQNYSEFKRVITEKYKEMRPQMLTIPMRRDLRFCIKIFKRSVVGFGVFHRLKTFIKRRK